MSGCDSRTVKWPQSMQEILRRYWRIQRKNGNRLSELEKQQFTEEMIQAYDEATYDEKIDILVPQKGQFLLDEAISTKLAADKTALFSIYYDMPENDGFKEGTAHRATMQIGEKYDRLGSENGRFLSRVLPTGPQPLESRALPYYIPEEDFTRNPAYHIYEVENDYSGIEPNCYSSDSFAVLRGEVAEAFGKKGLGEQTVIPKPDKKGNYSIWALKDGGYLK